MDLEREEGPTPGRGLNVPWVCSGSFKSLLTLD